LKASLIIDKDFKVAEVDKRIYGSFIEHLGRAVYGGIYEPGHPAADKNGFRLDVIKLIKELGVSIIRYPGGNFVSAYNWEDGVGPKENRPVRMELAWRDLETNEFGTNEFAEWSALADTEIMMAVNLGTRGADAARNLVEYCNHSGGTYYSDLRKSHGVEQPHNIKLWCLGNEMDGPWQMGAKTADDYALLARETAKMMKGVDPTIELIVCGGCVWDFPGLKNWDETVLDQTYDYVDYIAKHQYFNSCMEDDATFLAQTMRMDNLIKTTAALCRFVKGKFRKQKDIHISFDEWNAWYIDDEVEGDGINWKTAPARLENEFTLRDALLVGSILITLLKNSDTVKIACLAQLVNVIAPIMTQDGGDAWKQTIFYPFLHAAKYGRGTVMGTVVNSPVYDCENIGDVPYLDCTVVHNQEKDELVVFALNRSLDDEIIIDCNFRGFEGVTLIEHTELYSDDLKAVNTINADAVVPQSANSTDPAQIVLKKHSWNVIRLGVS